MPVEMSIEDPLEGHSRYSTLSYLSEGAFGFVVLAIETATQKQVSGRWYLCFDMSSDCLANASDEFPCRSPSSFSSGWR